MAADDKWGGSRPLSGEAVRYIRGEVGKGVLTVRQVAECLGVSYETVRRLVRGDTYKDVEMVKETRGGMMGPLPGPSYGQMLREKYAKEEEERERKVREWIKLPREAPIEYEEDEPAWLKQMKGGKVEG